MKKGLSITFRFREAGSRNRVAFCQVLLVHSKSFSPRPFRGSLGKISSIHIWCASQMVDRPSVSKTLNCQQDFMVLLKCEACNYFNFMSFLFSSKRLFFFFFWNKGIKNPIQSITPWPLEIPQVSRKSPLVFNFISKYKTTNITKLYFLKTMLLGIQFSFERNKYLQNYGAGLKRTIKMLLSILC